MKEVTSGTNAIFQTQEGYNAGTGLGRLHRARQARRHRHPEQPLIWRTRTAATGTAAQFLRRIFQVQA